MLLNILQCTGRPPAENEPAPHVSSADGKETQSQQRAQRLWSREEVKPLLSLWFLSFQNEPSEVPTFCVLQFSSVAQLCPTLSDPMDCSMPGFPVQLLGLTQTYVYQASDAIQPSHPLWSPSPLTFTLSQHQNLFQ